LIAALEPHPGDVFADCTFGRGGHTRALLRHLGSSGQVLAMDRDPQAIAVAEELAQEDQRVSVYQAEFAGLEAVMTQAGHCPDGVFFDLGVSSPQLDQAHRGFSFRSSGPLDMRMDPSTGISAADWLASATRDEISKVLKEFGEERYARRIASRIISQRQVTAIETTTQLADIIVAAMPAKARYASGVHPATRSFQAIRIQINSELEQLRLGLEQALKVLKVGGRLAVISFHSLEDRLVKRFIREYANPPKPSRHLPLPTDLPEPQLTVEHQAQRASEQECKRNPRARSAVLRSAVKCR
jgi:16S rRNA (cytosine1402-N4)-methyltransferase